MSCVVINNNSRSFCTDMHIFLFVKCVEKRGSFYMNCIFKKLILNVGCWINTVVCYKCKLGKLFKFTFKYFSCPSLLEYFHSFTVSPVIMSAKPLPAL